VVIYPCEFVNHRDTEDTKVAQRRIGVAVNEEFLLELGGPGAFMLVSIQAE